MHHTISKSTWVGLVVLMLGMAWQSHGQEERPTIVCFGDSITAGAYPALLSKMVPGCTVLNAGVGGNTTGAALKRMATDVLDKKPDYVLIMFGTNDSVLTGPGQYRTPLEVFQKNLESMLAQCRAAGAKPLLATLLPIISAPYFTRHPKEFYEPEGGLEAILARYRAVTVDLAKESGVSLVDMNQELKGDETHLKPDGVHPNETGERAIACLFASALKTAGVAGVLLPETSPAGEE